MKCCLSLALLLLAAPGLYAQPAYPPPAEVRAAVKKLLDRPQGDLAVKTEYAINSPDRNKVVYSFASERKADGTIERVPVMVVWSKLKKYAQGKLPAVICLHGTGGKKESQAEFMGDLANRGFVAVAIDA